MRYFIIYRNNCRVRKDREMVKTDFENLMWHEAWERAYEESDWDDENEEEYLNRVEQAAFSVLGDMMEEARRKGGCYIGDYYAYIRDDDVELMDLTENRPY